MPLFAVHQGDETLYVEATNREVAAHFVADTRGWTEPLIVQIVVLPEGATATVVQ